MLEALRRRSHLASITAYLALAVGVTWPVAIRFGSAAGGAPADVTGFVWSVWWWRDSLQRGVSPLLCDVLRAPAGVQLALDSWNLPAALALLPAWLAVPRLPEVALYNAVLLATLASSGMAARLLCLEIWGSELAAFLGGALYAVGAYHLGIAAGHVELVSMAASPVFLLMLLRTVRLHGAGAPVAAALALAVVLATSALHLVLCSIAAAVLVGAVWRAERPPLTSAPFLRRALLAAAVFATAASALAGLYVGRGEAVAPVRAATDVLSFLVPGPASAWRTAAARTASSPGGGYLGYAGLALAAYAALRAKAARRWLALGAVGLLLALGARLQVGSWTAELPLPYAWLARAVPALQREAPARFAWLAVLGASVAGAAALASIARAGRRGPAWAVALAAVAVVEIWPAAPVTALPSPRFLRDLSKDVERWAVLDLTPAGRPLWNQVLHRHPQAGAPAAYDRRDALAVADGGRRPPAVPSVKALQDAKVRFVIADPSAPLGAVSRLPKAYAGDGLVVHEVPPAGVAAGVLPRSAFAGLVRR